MSRFRDDSVSPEEVSIPITGDLFREGNLNMIEDGGNDLYDGGNVIRTNLYNSVEIDEDFFVEGGGVPYTHTQAGEEFPMDGEIASGVQFFGTDSTYFTNMYPGLFVLAANNISIDRFQITGFTGADTQGDVIHGSFEFDTYQCFWKSLVNNNSEPSLTHLIITQATTPELLSHEVNMNTDRDYDSLNGMTAAGCTKIWCFVYAVYNGGEDVDLTEAEQQDIAEAVLENVDPTSLVTTLSNFNSNYATVISAITNHYIFSDDGIGSTGLDDIDAFTYIGNTTEEFQKEFFAASDERLYRITISDYGSPEGVVTFVRGLPMPIFTMAYLDGTIYAVSDFVPFLIKMDRNGVVLNESDDDKFDTILEDYVEELIVLNGNELWGLSDGVWVAIDPETGEFIQEFPLVSDREYESITGYGVNPPPMERLFYSNESQFIWEALGDEDIDETIEIERNIAADPYASYGHPPDSGWAATGFTILSGEEIGFAILLTALTPEDFPDGNIMLRARYPNSAWVYSYWD